MPYNLTQSRLKELVTYDPETGIMAKRNPRPGVRIKTPEERKAVYTHMKLDNRYYNVHRLAFLYMTGEIPAEVDHKDGNTRNNKWDNLRSCNHSQNKANSRLYKNNTSGAKGVYFCKRDKVWVARVKKNGRRRTVGRFETLAEAAKAYARKAKRLFKEFARA